MPLDKTALAITDEWYRARVLIALLPIYSNPLMLVSHIQQAIASYLLTNRYQVRDHILSFLATETLFAPPVFSQDTIARIADQIIEICNEWTWL